MFQMFGFGGAGCPRCGHKDADKAGYCARCGLTPGAPRNAPVLRENRWVAGPDELAVFFGVRELAGVFVKTLRVPATARAYILQGDKATEVPQGEYEIEGFFTRLNHLLRDQHAEILVTRTGALPVEFAFDGLPTAEHLEVAARFTVSVKIENVPAFARHFMTMPGTIGSAQLRELLSAPVRQFAAEFIAARSIREMADNRELRAQLDERLQGALKLLLAQYGLAVSQVDTLALCHDKFDANRKRIGSLWLVADERHVQLEHAKHLDQLYNDEEWQRIRREEQEARLRHKRAELRQLETIERAELSLAGAERAHAIRSREIDLYGRIVESKSRRQAIERGAGDLLADLEHDIAKKGAQRAGEAAGWEHVRALAGIRMRTELEVAQQEARQSRVLAQQRFSHQLLQQQIRNKIEQVRQIEDAAHQRAELARLRDSELVAERRARALDDEEHAARYQLLVLANAARRREAERELEWEEELALGRKRELLRSESLQAEEAAQQLEAMRRSGASAHALAQHEKLLRTIEADHLHQRGAHQLQQELEARRDAHEIARSESFAAMDDAAKLALAPASNAAVLGDYLKTRVHAAMDPGQLAALAGVVAATNSVAPLDAARMAQERADQERAQRDAEVENERRHQLDLLALRKP
ncbi:MAG: SPFH domain-containing protein [Massilia sp.]